MLENDIIKPSGSKWSSVFFMVAKPDNTHRQCCSHLKPVNSLSKKDSYTIHRIDGSIDRIGLAKFVSKSDLLMKYYQVPFTNMQTFHLWLQQMMSVQSYAIWAKKMCILPFNTSAMMLIQSSKVHRLFSKTLGEIL